MEVMMVGEGCNDRISDVQKSGGVCNLDAIDQGGDDRKMGKIPRRHKGWYTYDVHF